MKRTIELTEQEQSIIENALNAYWNEAHEQLENRGVMMSDGTRRTLGDIEKVQLEKRKELTIPILRRFENLY
jgi:hypothetical protein